jgi:hypothetical protein
MQGKHDSGKALPEKSKRESRGTPVRGATPSWTKPSEIPRVLISPRPLLTIVGVTLVVGTLFTLVDRLLGAFTGRGLFAYFVPLVIVLLVVVGGHQARPKR